MRGLVVFDGDCGFCTTSVRFAKGRMRVPADAVPWQRADLGKLGLAEAACIEAVQYRDRSGRWHSAGRAVAAILIDSGLPWSALGRIARIPGIAWLFDRLYEWVAANRSRLPGGTPACEVPDRAA
jgi:predicted DCC family thiol-disulfide oxidoreductase YuxK